MRLSHCFYKIIGGWVHAGHVHDVMATLQVLSLFCCFALSIAIPEKIQIDPETQLYIGKDDGRVRMLHGLALEDSSPPWGLAVYSNIQIELMRQVCACMHCPCVYACTCGLYGCTYITCTMHYRTYKT